MEYRYLNSIDSPADLKSLPIESLPDVCAELRDFIINELSHNPGHLASSLGTIELTVALHYVYDTPKDKLVWDVGHQAYGHKILTGRRDRFHTNRQFKGLAPFPTPAESEYDAFIAGHASNSISAALGIEVAIESQKSRVKSGESGVESRESRVKSQEPRVVAIIGDGAMTGGLAFEGLNNTSMDKNNLLIILNDNNMAIDPIKGGFTQYLVDITTSKRYNDWRWRTYQRLVKWHILDEDKTMRVRRFSNNLKSILTKQQKNIFQGLNLRYFGPADGHNVIDLVRILNEIKDYRGPKVLHIITKKGKGYEPAENDVTTWHAPGEFDVTTGERQSDKLQITNDKLQTPPLWQEVFGETLLELAKEDERIVGVTPAMPSGCSMTIMQKEFPERVFDVGIAEGHAVTFSAGMASQGIVPFCNIYSSFLQRAYDNIIHDVALPKLHVVLCIDRAGIVGNDGATHHGLFDLAYLRPIPNLTIGAPMTGDDLRTMMRMAVNMEGPVAIRYPRGRVAQGVKSQESRVESRESRVESVGKGVCLKEGKDFAVLSIGAIGNTVSEAISQLSTLNSKLSIAHYDMRWLKPIDTEILDYVGTHFKKVVTVEDGVISGGLGSAVLEYFADKGYDAHVTRLGINNQFVEHGSTKELYHMLHLDTEGICESLLQALEK
ncbi:MAG: 1-deoxy-D-xylulose-5-phosphate synthase [Paludibacteraceae bacterium]|nr:1-deoxy-D-xylulose-5-phosphate synthase [Paludibacteraceae bacterium]